MTVKLSRMESEKTDEELMLNYHYGDVHAFEQLYSRHKGGLYRYLLRKCRNSSVAEELFQDIWLKLINASGHYEVKAKFSTWLYQIANNHYIDYYRRNSRSGISDLNGGDDPENIAAPAYQQPEQQIEASQQTRTLMNLIGQLPEEQREVFLLKEEAGMSLAEIAETTGVNIETAKSRLRYAVNRLRKGLDRDE